MEHVTEDSVNQRPDKIWPRPTVRGKAGYSARHFERVGLAADSPLTVAARLRDRELSDAAWPDRESAYQELCGSLELVIAVLSRHAVMPGIARYLRDARRAAKRLLDAGHAPKGEIGRVGC